MQIARNRATLRVSFDQIATDLKTKTKRTEKLHQTFILVKTSGIWKIWDCYPTEKDLAQKLISKMTDEERQSLLTKERDLVTKELVYFLNEQAENLRLQGKYQQAFTACHLAQEIAKRIEDRTGSAKALKNLGDIYLDQGEYELALKCLYESLEILKQLEDKKTIAVILNSIGNVYADQGNYILALEFY